MLRLLARLLPCILFTAALAGSASAKSEVPYKEKSAGALTSVAPDHLDFAAKGQATHFGQYTLVGGNDIDALGNVLNGQVTLVTADGETVIGVYSGTYAPLPTGQIGFQVTLEWIHGTGRLAGITGQAQVSAVVDGVAPGAGFAAQGSGWLVLP